MKHSSIAPPQDIHEAWCACRDCRRADPIKFAREASNDWVAGVLALSVLAGIYAFAASNWQGIAAAFGWQ